MFVLSPLVSSGTSFSRKKALVIHIFVSETAYSTTLLSTNPFGTLFLMPTGEGTSSSQMQIQ
jgi:hypothetical protein